MQLSSAKQENIGEIENNALDIFSFMGKNFEIF